MPPPPLLPHFVVGGPSPACRSTVVFFSLARAVQYRRRDAPDSCEFPGASRSTSRPRRTPSAGGRVLAAFRTGVLWAHAVLCCCNVLFTEQEFAPCRRFKFIVLLELRRLLALLGPLVTNLPSFDHCRPHLLTAFDLFPASLRNAPCLRQFPKQRRPAECRSRFCLRSQGGF